MANNGPIVTIDDDREDLDMLKDILQELGIRNPIVQYESCQEALEYLEMGIAEPFLIFCDMNLPKMNGIELKQIIDQNKRLREMSIPFVFYSTAADQAVVNHAYRDLNIQGYFLKDTSYQGMVKRVKAIVDYWLEAIHPDAPK